MTMHDSRSLNLNTSPVSAPSATRTAHAQPPIHDARALTQGGVLAHLDLDGQLYTLRITRAGKLILTK